LSHAVDQIATHPSKRDLGWLHGALQSAINLEHSTLPLYTAAMLSLEVQNYTSYNTIRSVLMEEMVHMAAAANMLAAIGGTPRLKDLDPGFPRAGLPGGVEPDLHVGLARLSRAQLRNFMRLEAPEFLLPDTFRHETYPTIGKLYLGIKDAIKDNAEEVRAAFAAGGAANQVGDNIGFDTFVPTPGTDPVDQLDAGIEEILAQGEGSGTGILESGAAYQDEESHYVRFAELWYGARYQEPSSGVPFNRENEAAWFGGAPIPWPKVINSLAVPSDGYDKLLGLDPDGPQVTADLELFDASYRGMMAALDKMWNGPAEETWPSFGEAVEAMTKQRVLSSFSILRYEIPARLIDRLPEIYPREFEYLAAYTDLNQPVFYGPRFRNRGPVIAA
jgi:hypothetical protein